MVRKTLTEGKQTLIEQREKESELVDRFVGFSGDEHGNIWWVPHGSDKIVKLNPMTGESVRL